MSKLFNTVDSDDYEITFTADDEEPDCMKCYNIDATYFDSDRKQHSICKKCGPDYCWNYYKRTEVIKTDQSAS